MKRSPYGRTRTSIAIVDHDGHSYEVAFDYSLCKAEPENGIKYPWIELEFGPEVVGYGEHETEDEALAAGLLPLGTFIDNINEQELFDQIPDDDF